MSGFQLLKNLKGFYTYVLVHLVADLRVESLFFLALVLLLTACDL